MADKKTLPAHPFRTVDAGWREIWRSPSARACPSVSLLEIGYIHARRLIKYSFAANATARTRVFRSSASSFSHLPTAASFLPPISFPPPSSLSLSLSLSPLPLPADPHSLATHSSRYIRVRTLLAITLARLQIALPYSVALMLARRKRRGKRDGGLRARK